MRRCLFASATLLLLTEVSTLAQQPSATDVAAVVNGETITVSDWIARMAKLKGQDFILSPAPLQMRPADAGHLALDLLISERLLLQYAAKTSLVPSDADVNTDFENAKKQPTITQALASKLLTEDQLKADLKLQRAIFNVATINASVTPEEIQDYYKKNYMRPAQWNLAMIRVSGKDKADKVAGELKNGTSFEKAAEMYSEDEKSKSKGGVIGNVATTDATLPEPIRAAIGKLNLNEVSPAIAAPNLTPDGRQMFFFVKLLGKEDAKSVPFEQVKDQVERLALFMKVGGTKAAEKKVEEFRKTSKVEIKMEGYQNLYANEKKDNG